MKPISLNFYILIKYLMNEMYYFALIANKAVPNEVVFLHETIGILITRSLIALH